MPTAERIRRRFCIKKPNFGLKWPVRLKISVELVRSSCLGAGAGAGGGGGSGDGGSGSGDGGSGSGRQP
ncbi:bacteriocin microcin [Cryobacterium sp. TmT2-59]|nr:bacteriocin microcin [Cryobacterium sp. TmT2-59]